MKLRVYGLRVLANSKTAQVSRKGLDWVMIVAASKSHPCSTCGACCNAYRVSFHYSEMQANSHGVPEALTHQTTPYQNAMNGTDEKNPRCIAFIGEVGEVSSCGIYENRPGCCRLFKASFENGERNLDCEIAREGKSLRALTANDWLQD